MSVGQSPAKTIMNWLSYLFSGGFPTNLGSQNMELNPQSYIREVTDPRAPAQEKLPTAQEHFMGQYQLGEREEESRQQAADRAFGPAPRQMKPSRTTSTRI